MLNKTAFSFSVVALLAACGGSDEGKTYPTQSVNGIGITTAITATDKYNASINSTGSTITITGPVSWLIINGSNNLLTVSPGTTIDLCTVNGSDNTIQAAAALRLTCTMNGPGNRVSDL